MTPVMELDKQTASFVRQLEGDRKLEKNLLVEQAQGIHKAWNSVCSYIKSHVATELRVG